MAVGENENGLVSVWDTQHRKWVDQFRVGRGDVRLAFALRTPLLAYWSGSYRSSAASSVPIGLWDCNGDLWPVRRSRNGGAAWTTVDTFQESANTYSEARGITVSPSGAIYVCGHAGQVSVIKGKKTTVNNWVVRRSLDGGTTWAVVDRFGAEPI